MSAAREWNFDGLVGPSHSYAGMAHGNLAAEQHAGQAADPRAAALQGIAKMRRVQQAGLAQGFLPPPLRPDWHFLHALGFRGAPGAVLDAAAREAPALLRAAWSAASMWTANAATVSPAADSDDGRLHLSVANLSSQIHRALEPRQREGHLRGVFAAAARFAVHAPLPGAPGLGDEGAANHTRLCADYGEAGVQVFVYGAQGQRFRARQARAASSALARRHGLAPERCVYLEQSAAAIDAGVFHNDVIAVGDRGLYLAHAQAYSEPARARAEVEAACRAAGVPLRWVEASAQDFPLADAVGSYVFNSQLLDDGAGGTWLLGPQTLREYPRVVRWLEQLVEEGVLSRWETMDLKQSMQNGGGPACLRLRVVLDAAGADALLPGAVATPAQLDALEAWVRRHYRDRVALEDLRDPALAQECAEAQKALAELMAWPDLLACH